MGLEKPCIIMLDNMKPRNIKKVIDELKEKDLYDHVLLEASGGINQYNIKEYAKTGVDVVSLGALTHSVKVLDLSQKMVV
jgi:nicotinate-nucleotide pyrophosphorylase (carboxylating)